MSKLEIMANMPADVRLLSIDGELAPSHYGTDQYRYRTDQGALYVSDAVAKIFDAAIAEYGIKAGDLVRIVKAAGTFEHGRKGVRWSLTPAAGAASNGTLAVPRIAPQAAPKPAPVAQAARPQWADHLLCQTNVLTDVYAAALKHSSMTHGNAVKPEDVRALMTTAFINLAKGAMSNAA